MNKAQIDELSQICRENNLFWNIYKNGQGNYTIGIDLKITSDNYRVMLQVLEEYQRRNQKPALSEEEEEELRKRKEEYLIRKKGSAYINSKRLDA